jgi:hypothetical protein
MPIVPFVHLKLILAAMDDRVWRAPALVPTGQSENSPAFQRRVIVGIGLSPTGTAEIHFHKYRSSYSMRCFFSNARNSS